MPDSPDELLPYLASNIVALLMIWLGWKKPYCAKLIWGIVFIVSAAISFYFGYKDPELIIKEFRETMLLPWDENKAQEYFRNNAQSIIITLSMYLFVCGILLLPLRPYYQIGSIAGAFILLCIATFGPESALPATLTMAASLVIMKIKLEKQARLPSIYKQLLNK